MSTYCFTQMMAASAAATPTIKPVMRSHFPSSLRRPGAGSASQIASAMLALLPSRLGRAAAVHAIEGDVPQPNPQHLPDAGVQSPDQEPPHNQRQEPDHL